MSGIAKLIHTVLLFVLFLAILPDESFARVDFQDPPTPVMHEARDWTLSVSPNYVNHPNAYPRIVAGINSLVFLGKYVSLNANLAAGQGYVQFGIGLIGAPLFLLLGAAMSEEIADPEVFLIWIAAIGTAFENMNFHIPVTSHFEVSPYFSLIRIKYIQEGYGGAGNPWNANLAGGIRLNIFLSDRFFIAPYVESTRDWGHGIDGTWGVNGGIHTGFSIRHK